MPAPRFHTELTAVSAALLLLLTPVTSQGESSSQSPPKLALQKSPLVTLTRTHQLMGTLADVVLALPESATPTEREQAIAAIDAAFAEMERIELLMTTWKPESTVSQINQNAGKTAVSVDPETLAVIQKSQWAARISGGAFDLTVGTFKGLWKFDQDRDGSIPTDAEVKARLPHVDFKKVVVKGNKVKITDPLTSITLGGSAKGYAVDRAVALLRKRGYRNFILQAGGDLYVSGDRGDRQWHVGIQDPRGKQPFASASLTNATFSTSGDYERYVVKDGRRYHHILDPHSGYPAMRSQSCTVIAKDALTADVISKPLFILGPKAGLAIAKKAGVDAVWVDASGQVTMTPGAKRIVKIIAQPTQSSP